MPFGIRPSNVRVCHSTTRALWATVKLSADDNGLQVAACFLGRVRHRAPTRQVWNPDDPRLSLGKSSTSMTTQPLHQATARQASKSEERNWVKIDLHIHTLDDPKDAVDYSAHQLLERARSLGFGVLAITLHDAVFDRREVYADAAAMGILLIPAAEVRLCGADVIVLNLTSQEVAELRNFDDLRRLRALRGNSIFTIAPHPFYVFGSSIGARLFAEIDCFDAIELCHFHKGLFNPNRRAEKAARRFGKPMIATSDAHQLHAFGHHYTAIQVPAAATIENVFTALRSGPLKTTSPPCSFVDLVSTIYFVFLAHPFRVRRKFASGKDSNRKTRRLSAEEPVDSDHRLRPNRRRLRETP
jgi:predicted metal-dependent phosphoesterase TrpH